VKRSAPLGAALLLTAVMVGVASLAVPASAHDPASSLPTLSQLRAAISATASQLTLPRPTIPALGRAIDGPSSAEYRGQTGCGDQTPGAIGDLLTETACTFGDRSATREILVTGDSEADMWMPTLDAWGQSEHWKIARLVDFGCVPWAERPPYENCGKFDAMVAAWVREHKPQIVFPVGLVESLQLGWVSVSAAQMAKEIEGMTEAWKPSGARVLVPQSIPWFYNYSFPQECLAAYPRAVQRCNDDPRSMVVSAGMLDGMSIAAKAGAIEVVPTEQLFCTPKTCPVLVGPWIVYADQHHFARTWGAHIERAFAAVFDPLAQGSPASGHAGLVSAIASGALRWGHRSAASRAVGRG
jgi:ABC-type amino acid transport substrate-binding protein